MSLATRCTSCGTVFRVVQDQLKVSEGWVRCGRCDAVFNALEGLFDLGRDVATGWDEPPGTAEEKPADKTQAKADDKADERAALRAEAESPLVRDEFDDGSLGDKDAEAAEASEPGPPSASHEADREGPPSGPIDFDDLLADPIDAQLFRKRGADGDGRKAHVDKRDRLDFSDARFDSDLFAENASPTDEALLDAPGTVAAEPALESAGAQPDFLRRADRRARWRSTPVRAALSVAALIGLLGLAVQVVHHDRDNVAAQWPATRPALAAWCAALGCKLEAPRRIDEVAVESTALTRAIGLDAFVLSVTLKSRSAVALLLPSVDLSLTDGNGRLVARRALSPSDFGSARLVQPGAEMALQLMLDTGSARVAGYTVEIFYP